MNEEMIAEASYEDVTNEQHARPQDEDFFPILLGFDGQDAEE